MIKIVMTPNVEEDTEDLYHSYTADGKHFEKSSFIYFLRSFVLHFRFMSWILCGISLGTPAVDKDAFQS